MAQRDLPWLGRLGISIDDAFGQLTAGCFKNELRAALAGPIGNADVRASFEPIAGFRAQSERL